MANEQIYQTKKKIQSDYQNRYGSVKEKYQEKMEAEGYIFYKRARIYFYNYLTHEPSNRLRVTLDDGSELLNVVYHIIADECKESYDAIKYTCEHLFRAPVFETTDKFGCILKLDTRAYNSFMINNVYLLAQTFKEILGRQTT